MECAAKDSEVNQSKLFSSKCQKTDFNNKSWKRLHFSTFPDKLLKFENNVELQFDPLDLKIPSSQPGQSNVILSKLGFKKAGHGRAILKVIEYDKNVIVTSLEQLFGITQVLQ